MPVKKPRRSHYSNKSHPKHYLKVYWPYLPLLVSVSVSLFIVIAKPYSASKNVLAYATNITRQGLLAETNKQRQLYSSAQLRLNDKLSQAAQAKAEDMADNNYWSHNTPDGRQPWFFIDQTGYSYLKAGENLAYGFDTSENTVLGWMNSASHRFNLLDKQFTDVGFGIKSTVSFQKNGNQTIVVAMYGLPSSSSETAGIAQSTDPDNSNGLQLDTSSSQLTKTLNSSTEISFIQMLTRGKLPWSSFALGVVLGGIILYFLLKHGLSLRRVIKKGESFIIHHPLLDATLLSFIVLGLLLNQVVGSVL